MRAPSALIAALALVIAACTASAPSPPPGVAVAPGIEATLPDGWTAGADALARYGAVFETRPAWQGDLRFFEAYVALAEAGGLGYQAAWEAQGGVLGETPDRALLWVALEPADRTLDDVERRLQSWQIPGQRTTARTERRTAIGPGSATVERLDFSFAPTSVIGHHVRTEAFLLSLYLVGPTTHEAWLTTSAEAIAASLRFSATP